MRKLIMPAQREFHRDTEGFDRHDGNRADGGANRDEDERVPLAVDGRDSVDHDGRENSDCETVDQEPWKRPGSVPGKRHTQLRY